MSSDINKLVQKEYDAYMIAQIRYYRKIKIGLQTEYILNKQSTHKPGYYIYYIHIPKRISIKPVKVDIDSCSVKITNNMIIAYMRAHEIMFSLEVDNTTAADFKYIRKCVILSDKYLQQIRLEELKKREIETNKFKVFTAFQQEYNMRLMEIYLENPNFTSINETVTIKREYNKGNNYSCIVSTGISDYSKVKLTLRKQPNITNELFDIVTMVINNSILDKLDILEDAKQNVKANLDMLNDIKQLHGKLHNEYERQCTIRINDMIIRKDVIIIDKNMLVKFYPKVVKHRIKESFTDIIWNFITLKPTMCKYHSYVSLPIFDDKLQYEHVSVTVTNLELSVFDKYALDNSEAPTQYNFQVDPVCVINYLDSWNIKYEKIE